MAFSNRPIPYDKPWLSLVDQIKRLQTRGLVISDIPRAEAFLSHLNYYRFSGYCLAFEKCRHSYPQPTRFEDVQAAYVFDVSLRDLLTEALEVIEVDVRATLAYQFGCQGGAFGHIRSDNFRPSFSKKDRNSDSRDEETYSSHQEWMEKLHDEVKRSKEPFILHFKNKYSGFPNLPLWMVTEIMSFGSLSKLYSGLKDHFQSSIANRYNMQKPDLGSALHHLSYVRNLCAHHCRLWDRRWSISPKLPAGTAWRPPHLNDPHRLFITLLLIYRILKKCKTCELFTRDWRRRINELTNSLLRWPTHSPAWG